METTKVANIHIYSHKLDLNTIQLLVKTLVPELSHLADEHWFHINDNENPDWTGLGQTDIFIFEVGGKFNLTDVLCALVNGLVIIECFMMKGTKMNTLGVYQWGKPYELVSLDQEVDSPRLENFKFEI